MNGIDISQWEGTIDWKKASEGIDFVMIRAGYGKGHIDKHALEYLKQTKAIGLKVGVYWFSYAYTVDMAKKEGKYCADFMDKYDIDLPVFFDYEERSEGYANDKGISVSDQLIRDMADAFCTEILSHSKCAGVYCNLKYFKRYTKEYFNSRPKLYLWFAQWGVKEPTYGFCDYWQTTDKGVVNGISGYTDLDKTVATRMLIKLERG